MNLAQSIDKLWTFLLGLAQSIPVCFGGGYGAVDCSVMWKVVMGTIAIVLTVTALLLARRVVRSFLRYRAAIKQLRADKTVASQEVMNEFRWDGDKARSTPKTHQQMAAQIKAAMRHN